MKQSNKGRSSGKGKRLKRWKIHGHRVSLEPQFRQSDFSSSRQPLRWQVRFAERRLQSQCLFKNSQQVKQVERLKIAHHYHMSLFLFHFSFYSLYQFFVTITAYGHVIPANRQGILILLCNCIAYDGNEMNMNMKTVYRNCAIIAAVLEVPEVI